MQQFLPFLLFILSLPLATTAQHADRLFETLFWNSVRSHSHISYSMIQDHSIKTIKKSSGQIFTFDTLPGAPLWVDTNFGDTSEFHFLPSGIPAGKRYYFRGNPCEIPIEVSTVLECITINNWDSMPSGIQNDTCQFELKVDKNNKTVEILASNGFPHLFYYSKNGELQKDSISEKNFGWAGCANVTLTLIHHFENEKLVKSDGAHTTETFEYKYDDWGRVTELIHSGLGCRYHYHGSDPLPYMVSSEEFVTRYAYTFHSP